MEFLNIIAIMCCGYSLVSAINNEEYGWGVLAGILMILNFFYLIN